MEAILGFLNNPMLLTPLQLIVGYFLKKNPSVKNGFIPLANFAIAILAWTLALVGAPSNAHAGIIMVVAVSTPWWQVVGKVLLDAAIQTAGTTGLHSTWKNFFQAIRI